MLDQNEATTVGIIQIMPHQHKLVPGHGTENVVKILSVDDLLYVRRHQNAQEDLCDFSSPSERLEGLVPALADFNSYGNVLVVS